MDKKRLGIIGAAIVGIIIIAMIAFAPKGNEQEPIAQQESQETQSQIVTVEIQRPEGTDTVEVDYTDGLTAFDALKQAIEATGQSLSYDPPGEFGVFVKEIAGIANGIDNKYWVFEVNDQMVPVAADRLQLSHGDKVVWKFVEPQY